MHINRSNDDNKYHTTIQLLPTNDETIICHKKKRGTLEIIVGKLSGFCFGVENAVKKANEILEIEPATCLGELVHNRQVIEKLEKKGLHTVEKIDEVPDNSKVIIRAHGIAKEVYEQAQKRNITINDFTCPKVLAIHKIAERENKDSYIFLIGDKNHPEIIGTSSFCGKDMDIIQEKEELKTAIENFKKSEKNKLYVIAQTTFSMEKFEDYAKYISNKLKEYDVKINNTICDSTRLRQEEVEEISKAVDYVIIVGGKNSANTQKLYNIAIKNCPSIHIQTKDDLNIEEIKKYNKIGISAGASTPKESIDEVVEMLERI